MDTRRPSVSEGLCFVYTRVILWHTRLCGTRAPACAQLVARAPRSRFFEGARLQAAPQQLFNIVVPRGFSPEESAFANGQQLTAVPQFRSYPIPYSSRGFLEMKTAPSHPKLRGELAEIQFLARAAALGLRVSKPYGDCLPYDFIVEHGGRMLRVQVKSTSYQNPGYTAYKCFVKPSPKGKRYPAGAVDFIAAYVLPEDVWYILPFRQIASTSTVCLDPRNPRNRYRPYREAWDLLLANTPAGPAIHRKSLKQMSS